MKTAIDVIEMFAYGLITEREAIQELDKLEVRGGFSNDGFTGFDYKNQEWIVIEFKDYAA